MWDGHKGATMMKNSKRTWLSLAFFLAFISLAVQGSSEHLSFDRLYPQTWFSRVIDNCMKIWSEIEVVEAFDAQEQERIFDACLGRVVYCQHLYGEAHKTRLHKKENIPYLIQGLERIDKRCDKIKSCAHSQKMDLFKAYLRAFKTTLLDQLGS